MKRLLRKFEDAAERRLRLSQMRILYQNQRAIEFINVHYSASLPGLFPAVDQIAEGIAFFDSHTRHCIVALQHKAILDEDYSKQLLEVNQALKSLYAGVIEGKQRARAIFKDSTEDLVPFEKMFAPACGWKNFSETEFEAMVEKAL